MWLDQWATWCLIALALWILLSGLDDLFIILVHMRLARRPFAWPSQDELAAEPERRIAVLVPLWHEDGVIEQMLERNLAVIRYRSYHIFTGVYPNDKPTLKAVRRVARRHPRVHPAICARKGPTSKGDCLNNAWRHMCAFEDAHGFRFEIVMMHDAEDLIDPDSLRLVNRFSREYDMIQIPVLPLPTPVQDFTHGVYCDEFAEYQTKDIPVRQQLGGFLPSNGVGTAFSRAALDELAEERQGRVFDPESLTEDYETGFRLHAAGWRQLFVPVRLGAGDPIATREYFPRTFRAAVRQRSRWVAGIALQGWARHGWDVPWLQVYWFWRDRKGLVGNLITPLANALFLYGICWFGACCCIGAPWPGELPGRNLAPFWVAAGGISVAQMVSRTYAATRIYGWRFGLGVPFRTPWANIVNCAATLAALMQFFGAQLRNETLAWRKTDHVYPQQPVPDYNQATFSEQP